MTSVRRLVVESPIGQGDNEEIPYQIDTTPWGTPPSGVVAKVRDSSNGDQDVTATVMPGTPSVNGNVITLPALKLLVPNHTYRLDLIFFTGSTKWEAVAEFKGED